MGMVFSSAFRLAVVPSRHGWSARCLERVGHRLVSSRCACCTLWPRDNQTQSDSVLHATTGLSAQAESDRLPRASGQPHRVLRPVVDPVQSLLPTLDWPSPELFPHNAHGNSVARVLLPDLLGSAAPLIITGTRPWICSSPFWHSLPSAFRRLSRYGCCWGRNHTRANARSSR